MVDSLTSAFFAGTPGSYSAMEMRKKIALAKMLQNRGGYPKTLGEGIYSAGTDITDALTLRRIEQQQAEYDARKLAEKKAEEGGQSPKVVNEGEDPPDRPGTQTVSGPTVYPELRPDPNRRVFINEPTPLTPPTPPNPQEIAPPPNPQIQSRSLQPPPDAAAAAQAVSPSQNPLLNQYPIEPAANAPFPGPDVQSQQVPQSVAARQVPTSPPSVAPTATGQVAPGAPPGWFGAGIGNINQMQAVQPHPTGMPPEQGAFGAASPPGPQAAAEEPPPDIRSDIAMSLAGRGPGGPPPNPMMGGQTPAAMPATLMSGGGLPTPDLSLAGSPPEAAQNRPITMRDIAPGPMLTPGAQLAQAQVKAPNPMEGRPRVFIDTVPAPAKGVQVPAVRPAPEPATTPGEPERGQSPEVYARPVEPKPFNRTADPPDLTRFRRNERYADDPDMKAYWAAKAADVEKQRAAVDERLQKEYENKYNAYIQADQAWLSHQRSLPKTQAETSQAQSEASVKADQAVISSRHGGIPAEKVFADFADRQKLAKANVDMLKQAKIARQALDAGIFSGPLANLQLDKARLEAWMLKNKAAGDLATNSQIFRAAVESTLGGAVRTIQPGGGPTTETDMRIAKGIVGATPELQEAAKRKILNQFIGNLHGDLADYEDRVGRSFGGLPKVEPHWEVNRSPLHGDPAVEKQYVDRLLENKDNLAARKRFDELFGEGAAALEIARAKRRGGR